MNRVLPEFCDAASRPSTLRFLAPSYRILCLALLGLAAGLMAPSLTAAQALSGSQAKASEPVARIGIGGQYRVGQWTALQLADPRQVQVETIDGDGVRARYVDAAPQSSRWRYVLPGAASAPLVLRDAEGQVLQKTRFPDGPVAANRRWVMVLGDPLGIDQIGKNELLDRDAKFATSVITDVSMLPDHWLGYQSIDAMVITATAAPLLSQIDEPTVAAITTWVQRGGLVITTLGEKGLEAYQQAPLVQRLIPFESPPTVVPMEPKPIESYANSKSLLPSFGALTLPTQVGEPLLIGRSLDRRPMAFAMKYRVGLGHVIAIAADLDRPPFVDWQQRKDLIDALTPELLPLEEVGSKPRLSSDVNYNDLAGQVRATLDRFEGASKLPFSVVALALMGLFLLIGPIDYLLVNRWLKRPLLGWLTFPLVILAGSVGLAYWSLAGNRSGVILNRLEVIDINGIANTGRGFRWDFLYSPQAGQFDLQTQWSDAVAPIAVTGRSASESRTTMTTAPFGHSSSAFGGIEVQVENERLPAYQIEFDRTEQQMHSRVLQTPLAAASSKGFGTWWNFEFQTTAEQGLQRRRRAELEGRLVNPLPVDLLDGMLLDRDKVYMLPSRFRAGATIERVEDLRPRVLRWLLTGRKKAEDITMSERWEQADDQRLSRLADVLGFYRMAGGESYTGMSNEPLRQLDLSEILTNDRALLIGRLERPATTLTVRPSTELAAADKATAAASVEDGKVVSMVRILLPVELVRTSN